MGLGGFAIRFSGQLLALPDRADNPSPFFGVLFAMGSNGPCCDKLNLRRRGWLIQNDVHG